MPHQRSTGPDGKKKCTGCRRSKPTSGFYHQGLLLDGSVRYQSRCRSCVKSAERDRSKRLWGDRQLAYSAYRRTRNLRAFLGYLRLKAKERAEVSFTSDDLMDLWGRQGGKCALTGWEMTARLGDGVVATNASIDRIDSSVGYDLSNIQIVCRVANMAKSNLTMAEFIKMCRSIVENYDGKNPSVAAQGRKKP